MNLTPEQIDRELNDIIEYYKQHGTVDVQHAQILQNSRKFLVDMISAETTFVEELTKLMTSGNEAPSTKELREFVQVWMCNVASKYFSVGYNVAINQFAALGSTSHTNSDVTKEDI